MAAIGYGTINAITATKNRDVLVVGSLINKKQQAYFFKLDSHGNMLWKRVLDLRKQAVLVGVHELKEGGFILTGIYSKTYHPAGILGTTKGAKPLIIHADSLGHIKHIASGIH